MLVERAKRGKKDNATFAVRLTINISFVARNLIYIEETDFLCSFFVLVLIPWYVMRYNFFNSQFFIQQLRSTMDKPEATRKEIAAAIKGYGHFAAVCTVVLNSLFTVYQTCTRQKVSYSILC